MEWALGAIVGRNTIGMLMSPNPSFKNLRVWQEANALAIEVDQIAGGLSGERASLADQIRRSSASVPRNIAEGYGRPSDRDFARYLVMAEGSLHELESDMIRIRMQSLAPGQQVADIEVRIPHVQQLLSGLLRKLRPPDR